MEPCSSRLQYSETDSQQNHGKKEQLKKGESKHHRVHEHGKQKQISRKRQLVFPAVHATCRSKRDRNPSARPIAAYFNFPKRPSSKIQMSTSDLSNVHKPWRSQAGSFHKYRFVISM